MEEQQSQAERDEEKAQKEYEETMNSASTKRSDDLKLMNGLRPPRSPTTPGSTSASGFTTGQGGPRF